MSSRSYQSKYNYQKSRPPYRRRVTAQSRTKKLVTGRGPTMLEQIASGVGSVAKLAGAVAPIVAAVNTEMKYVDNTASVTAYVPGTNDSINQLTGGLINGSQDNQRIGNSVLAKDIQVRMAINFTPSSGPPNVLGLHCRAMLIVWKDNAQQNIPTAAKIFEVPSNLYSAINKDYCDQFVVLKDKFFTLNAQNSQITTGAQAFTTMKWYKKLGFHIRWDGAAGSNGTQNHVYLVLRSSAGGVGTALNCTWYSRFNFTDN